MSSRLFVTRYLRAQPRSHLRPRMHKMDLSIPATTIQVTSHNQYVTPRTLAPATVLPSPMAQFQAWFQAAIHAGVHEPEAMALTTVAVCPPPSSAVPDPSPFTALPSTRIVLLKQADPRGFVFYTNYGSRKSRELAQNPHAALCFYWREVHRSVRVVGRAEKVSAQESDAYFASRPRGSQVGAVASPQSQVVQEGELEKAVKEVEGRFEGRDVERPEGWGGWRVVPFEVEFWEGKPSRLHDRVRYTVTNKEGEWAIDRLAP